MLNMALNFHCYIEINTNYHNEKNDHFLFPDGKLFFISPI